MDENDTLTILNLIETTQELQSPNLLFYLWSSNCWNIWNRGHHCTTIHWQTIRALWTTNSEKTLFGTQIQSIVNNRNNWRPIMTWQRTNKNCAFYQHTISTKFSLILLDTKFFFSVSSAFFQCVQILQVPSTPMHLFARHYSHNFLNLIWPKFERDLT